MLITTSQSARGEELLLELATDFQTLEPIREEWDAAVLRLGAPVCMTLDWLTTWWEYYGDRNQLRIFVFRRGERVVGMLPVYLETFGIGPWKTIVARIVGANIPPRCFNPPVDAACAVDMFAQVYRQLFVSDGCDMLSFGPVSEDWSARQALFAAIRIHGEALEAASTTAVDVRSTFTLSGEFVQKLNSKKTAKHYLRGLERYGEITTDVISEPADLGESFTAFASQHAAQWRALGKGGHFLSWPRGCEFHQTLVKHQGARGRVRFYRLLAAGQMIACCYAYVFGSMLAWELPSRLVGPEWEKLGLGKAAFIRMCQNAAVEGVLNVDAGLGQYTYKSNLGGVEVPVHTFRVVSSRWSSRTRVAALLIAANVFRILYHKIWYRRIIPRLPHWVSRSQWRYWLRFDL